MHQLRVQWFFACTLGDVKDCEVGHLCAKEVSKIAKPNPIEIQNPKLMGLGWVKFLDNESMDSCFILHLFGRSIQDVQTWHPRSRNPDGRLNK
jgi:hypothetical protein